MSKNKLKIISIVVLCICAIIAVIAAILYEAPEDTLTIGVDSFGSPIYYVNQNGLDESGESVIMFNEDHDETDIVPTNSSEDGKIKDESDDDADEDGSGDKKSESDSVGEGGTDSSELPDVTEPTDKTEKSDDTHEGEDADSTGPDYYDADDGIILETEKIPIL